MNTRRTPYGEDSIRWALPQPGMRALTMGQLAGLSELAANSGHLITCLADTPAEAAAMASRVNCGAVTADSAHLPFAPHSFDRVLISEGYAAAHVPEIARALRIGGHVIAALTIRDDTVPWVKRLARLVQRLDPTAMRGDYRTETIEAIVQSPHFSPAGQHSSRSWVPISRQGLLDMVSARPAVQRHPEAERSAVLAEIGTLYDTIARVPDPLLLPFDTTLWAGVVDHSALGFTQLTDSVRIRID